MPESHGVPERDKDRRVDSVDDRSRWRLADIKGLCYLSHGYLLENAAEMEERRGLLGRIQNRLRPGGPCHDRLGSDGTSQSNQGEGSIAARLSSRAKLLCPLVASRCPAIYSGANLSSSYKKESPRLCGSQQSFILIYLSVATNLAALLFTPLAFALSIDNDNPSSS
jgi:hypothetical protein